jgi:5-methylcytosine-specific restriction endonuclease McrA
VPTPKIGQLVKLNLPQIIAYCERTDPDEMIKLADVDYCRDELGLAWAFFKTPAMVEVADEHKRYWVETHQVLDREVRVTSQWFAKHLPRVVHYLMDKGLVPIGLHQDEVDVALAVAVPQTGGKNPGGTRYKIHAIGNAQNSAVRWILGNIGQESFTEKQWLGVKASFNFCCAYCGTARHLVMDHAVPISIDSLGEHKLGNLVPACSSCNSDKGQQQYDVFARQSLDPDSRIAAIEAHMSDHGYEPLAGALSAEQSEAVREALRLARQQIADSALTAVRAIDAIVVAGE